ncbi:MAG: type II secretion system protein GspK, partial [Moraxella sp.]|nr:type II secretion system protein GspK [Moraxella sp.]
IYANAPMRTANELLYLPNMTGEVLAEILPFVTAHQVESDKDIAINVNSASAVVLSAITQGEVGVSQLRPILAKQQTGFKTTDEFWQTAPLSSYQEPTLTPSQEKRFVNKTALTTTQTHVVGITITVLEDERQKSAFYLLKNTATDDTQKKFVVIAKRPVYP